MLEGGHVKSVECCRLYTQPEGCPGGLHGFDGLLAWSVISAQP